MLNKSDVWEFVKISIALVAQSALCFVVLFPASAYVISKIIQLG